MILKSNVQYKALSTPIRDRGVFGEAEALKPPRSFGMETKKSPKFLSSGEERAPPKFCPSEEVCEPLNFAIRGGG